MKLSFILPLVLLGFGGPIAVSGELDPGIVSIPDGLIVRISPDGKREVFKANLKSGIVTNSDAAEEMILDSVKPENKINDVTPMVSELDQVSSDDSWHWNWTRNESYWGPGNPSYNYHYGYYNNHNYYNYYPSYNYSHGGYQYTNYYSGYHYGYHSGYHNSDQSGWHYGGHYGWHNNWGHRW